MQGAFLASAAKRGSEEAQVPESRSNTPGADDLSAIQEVLHRLSVVPPGIDKDHRRTQLLEDLVNKAQHLLEEEERKEKAEEEKQHDSSREQNGGSKDSRASDRGSNLSKSLRSFTRLPVCPAASHGGLRKRTFLVFDDHATSKLSKLTLLVLVLTILVSTVTFLMESEPRYKYRKPECASCRARHAMYEAAVQAGRVVDPADDCKATVEDCKPIPHEWFYMVEAVCIGIFTVDYAIRVLLSHAGFDGKGQSSNPFARTFAYWRQPMNIVDLLAILPFYVELGMSNSGGLGVIAVLRLARILRIFKLTKHHPGVKMFAEVLVMSGQPLFVLVFLNFIIVLVFGTLIYNVEGQTFSVDDKFVSSPLFENGTYVRSVGFHNMETEFDVSPFQSIPRSIWWVTVTLTTVGYGDYSPTTLWGKTVGVIAFYVGILFLALPISVLGSNFEIVYKREFQQAEAEQDRKRKEEEEKKDKLAKLRRASVRGGHEATWFPRAAGKPPMDVRKKVFLLFDNPSASKLGKVIALFMLLVILVVTTSFILESMPRFNDTPDECQSEKTVDNCEPVPPGIFHTIEVVGIGIFTFDYVMRLLTVHVCKPFECGISIDDVEVAKKMPGWKVTLMYAMQTMNIIDLLAILPFYLQAIGLAGSGASSVLRVLRLIRVFRVLKMPQMSSCVTMFVNIIADSFPALLLLFFMSFLTCIMTSSCLVFAEGSDYSVDHGPGSKYALKYGQEICGWEGCYVRPTYDGYDTMPSPFISIPYAFWWFFTTATTVGYGDDYPTTTLGKIIGVITFYVGIVLLALPITIVGGFLSKHYGKWVDDLESMRAEAGLKYAASTTSKVAPEDPGGENSATLESEGSTKQGSDAPDT